jgi:hypothetical protein
MKEAASVGGLFGIIKLKSAYQRIVRRKAENVHRGCLVEPEYLMQDRRCGYKFKDRIARNNGISWYDRVARNYVLKRDGYA